MISQTVSTMTVKHGRGKLWLNNQRQLLLWIGSSRYRLFCQQICMEELLLLLILMTILCESVFFVVFDWIFIWILNFSDHHDCCANSPTVDDSTFKYLAHVYSENHPIMKTGTDCNETFPGGITNGAYWYELNGESLFFTFIFKFSSIVAK